MYYEINVSKMTKEGFRHLFATNPRSCPTKDKVKSLLAEFAKKFPLPEYKIIVSLFPEQSLLVNIEELLNQ